MADAAGPWALVVGLVFLSVGCTILLRWAAQSPGSTKNGSMAWPMLGGLLAGILLGPSILGRVIPREYEQWFTGGAAEWQSLRELTRRQGADLLIAERARLSPDEIRSLRDQHGQELAKANADRQHALWGHQRPIRRVSIALAGLALLGCGAFTIRSRGRESSPLHALTIEVCSVAVLGLLAFLAMTAWWGYSSAPAVLVAAVVSIGRCTFRSLNSPAANVTSALTIAIAAAALYSIHGVRGLAYSAAFLGLPIGWLLSSRMHRRRIILERAFAFVFIPSLMALVTVKIDLFEDLQIWPLLVIPLLCGLAGAFPAGRRADLSPMQRPRAPSFAGPAQISFTAIVAYVWAIPDSTVLPLLAGAIFAQALATVRTAIRR